MQEDNKVSSDKVEQAGAFSTKIGRTTYVVGVFFNEKSKASYDDKAKNLIMNELKSGNF